MDDNTKPRRKPRNHETKKLQSGILPEMTTERGDRLQTLIWSLLGLAILWLLYLLSPILAPFLLAGILLNNSSLTVNGIGGSGDFLRNGYLKMMHTPSSRPSKTDPTGISCVVPPLLFVLEAMSKKYFGVQPLIVGPGVKTGMLILYDNPREVGADRIVNGVAAFERYRWPSNVWAINLMTRIACRWE